MKGVKLGFCIGAAAIMLTMCQPGIRSYIGAVGLTRVHADETVIYPCIPLTEGRVPSQINTTNHLVDKTVKTITAHLCASAREAYVERGTGEASASDGGSYGEPVGNDGEGYVLPPEDVSDGGDYLDVAQDDSGTYLGEFTATAYCPCPICCGEYSSGYTASGTLATEGRTIACNSLPIGTEVSVDGNTYVVEDTGWSPYGENWIDIFFADHDSALAYGMRTVDVYLIG